MDTIKFKKKKVKMIAHRGLSGLEKENTCAAFIAAGNRTTDKSVAFKMPKALANRLLHIEVDNKVLKCYNKIEDL